MLAKVIVTLAGMGLIVGVNWYFLGDLLRRSGKRGTHHAGQ